MYYRNPDKLMELEIKNYKEAAALCDKVVEVIKKFDGKVLNVRLEKALKEATGERIQAVTNCVKDDFVGAFSLEWCYKNASTYKHIYICNVSVNRFEAAAIQNKRIVANNIIPALMERKKDLLEKAEKLEKSIGKISEWMEKIEKIKKENNKLYYEIPCEIREYYNMGIKYY